MDELFDRQHTRSADADVNVDVSSSVSTVCDVQVLGKDTSQ